MLIRYNTISEEEIRCARIGGLFRLNRQLGSRALTMDVRDLVIMAVDKDGF